MKISTIVKAWLCVVVCLLGCAMLPADSAAQYIDRPDFFYFGNFWAGYPVRSIIPYKLRRRHIHFEEINLEVDPFIFVTQTYDSNIYYEPSNEKEDFVTTVTPGVALRWPLRGGRYLFTAGYAADIINFWKYTDESRVDHLVRAQGDLDFNSGFRLMVRDIFRRTADPADSEITEDYERYRNVATIALGYDRDRWGVEVGYINVRDDYDDVDTLDKWTHNFFANGIYRLFNTTSLMVEYEYGIIRYDDPDTFDSVDGYYYNSNGYYQQALVGIEQELANKLKALFKVGYQWRNYSRISKENYSGFIMHGNLKYTISDRTRVELFGEKRVNQSTYQGKSYYTIYRAGFELQQDLGRKFTLALQGVYQYNRYPGLTEEEEDEKHRKSDLWAAFVDLRYQVLEWLSTDLIYSYRERDDTYDMFDYDRHMLSLQISSIF